MEEELFPDEFLTEPLEVLLLLREGVVVALRLLFAGVRLGVVVVALRLLFSGVRLGVVVVALRLLFSGVRLGVVVVVPRLSFADPRDGVEALLERVLLFSAGLLLNERSEYCGRLSVLITLEEFLSPAGGAGKNTRRPK